MNAVPFTLALAFALGGRTGVAMAQDIDCKMMGDENGMG